MYARNTMLFATDRPLHFLNAAVALFADPNSVTRTTRYRQRENTPYAASPGSSGLMTNLRTGADATMRHSHISGDRAFSHCHDVRSIASGSWNFACGRLAGDGCHTSWEVVVKGHQQHNRTWLIVH